MTRRLLTYAVVAIAAVLPGCGNTADKTGGAGAGEPHVLRLANGNLAPEELQVFADEVDRRSGGALRIEFAGEWRLHQVGYEHGLVDDVKHGKADLGWVGARAFPELGVHSFDALLAPLLVDSYALEQRAIEQLGERMLAGAAAAGVHPVALLPGPMRRLVAREPVRGPGDLAGRRLLIQPAGIEEAAARALGAEAVRSPSGARLGDLDGALQHLGSIAGNRYYDDARFLTSDVALWPRPLVVFAGPDAWERLSRSERSILLDAGRAAIPATMAAVRDRDAAALEVICAAGERLVSAGSGGRAAMLTALEPVYAQLRERPATARDIDAIERLRGAAGPDALPGCADARGSAPETGGIPDGDYRWTFRQGDKPPIPPELHTVVRRSIRFHLAISDGRFFQTQSEDGAPEEFGYDASYTLHRDRITLREGSGLEMTMRWSFDGKRLRFTDIGGRVDDKFVWGSRPWVKDR